MGAYEILPGLIGPADRALALAEIDRLVRAGASERTFPSVLRLASPPFGQALLAALQPTIERAALTPISPASCYAYVYARGAVQPLHVDTSDCPVTVSVTLDYRSRRLWPLLLVTEDDIAEITLDRGEAVLFDATRHLHCRRPFRGRSWTQLSLHYDRAADPALG